MPIPREPIPIIQQGLRFSAYLIFSFFLFLITSNTILGGMVYLFLLLPFYGLLFLGVWLFIGFNRTQRAKIRGWIWGIILGLQLLVMLVAPGNCYGIKQGQACYSNLQILFGGVSPVGLNSVPHWQIIEDAFLGVVFAYGVALLIGVLTIKKYP